MTIEGRIRKAEKALDDTLDREIEAERERVGDEAFDEVLTEVEAVFMKKTREVR